MRQPSENVGQTFKHDQGRVHTSVSPDTAMKERIRERIIYATSIGQIEDHREMQDILDMDRDLPPFLGSRVALRLRPTRNKVKFSQFGDRTNWKERGRLYGLQSPMRRTMEGHHSYGARFVKKRKQKPQTTRKLTRVVKKNKLVFTERNFTCGAWSISLFQNTQGLFIVTREHSLEDSGELEQFKTAHEALQQYAQWIVWAKHQPTS